MSQRANPAAVGAFVLGAAALLLLGVAWLGSGALFVKLVLEFQQITTDLSPMQHTIGIFVNLSARFQNRT